MAKRTTNLDDDKAQPRGDTGDDKTGVPSDEQGISNREGDADDDEFEDDEADDSDEEEDEDSESSV